MESQQIKTACVDMEKLERMYKACVSLYGSFLARARLKTGGCQEACRRLAREQYGGASVLADLLGISPSQFISDLHDSESRQVLAEQKRQKVTA